MPGGAGVTVRTIAMLAVLAIAAGGGWFSRGWFEDAQRLTALEAARAATSQALDRKSVV